MVPAPSWGGRARRGTLATGMDFLKIRKKARERAPARRPAPGVAPPGTGPAPAPEKARAVADEPAGSVPTFSEPPPASAQGVDPRFTTWRPGTGERPFIPAPDPSQPPPEPQPVQDPAHQRRARGAPAPPAALAAREPPSAEAVAPAPRVSGGHPRTAPERDPLDEFFFRDDEEVPALAALPADVEPVPAAGEDVGVEEYLTFRLGVEEYAVAIELVREVLKAQQVTEVPRAPAGVLGVVTVRGEVVAVFDPRRRLGLPGAPPREGSGRIVIVDDGEGPCGLLVDGVASVVRLPRGSIEPCPQGIGGASADCLAGIGRERSRLFTVLELGALLRRAPELPRGGRAHAGT